MLFCTGWGCLAVRVCVDKRGDIVGFHEMVGCQVIKWATLLQQICRGIIKGGTCRKKGSRLFKIACQAPQDDYKLKFKLKTLNCQLQLMGVAPMPLLLLSHSNLILDFDSRLTLRKWLILYLMSARGLHSIPPQRAPDTSISHHKLTPKDLITIFCLEIKSISGGGHVDMQLFFCLFVFCGDYW